VSARENRRVAPVRRRTAVGDATLYPSDHLGLVARVEALA